MPGIKQCFSWWAYHRGADAGELLRAARAIGYEGVELIGQEYWDIATDSGLKIVTHGGHDSIESGLDNPANHARIRSEIESNLELAVKYGIPNLIVFPGSRRVGLSEADGAKITADALLLLAPLAEQAGVNLIMEVLNSKVDHPSYQGDHTAWARGVCEAVNSPHVKILYDIYHMQIMEGDIIRTIQANASFIEHYHTAGNPGRRDLDDTQEIQYPPIVRAILETGYSEYLGHEFMPKGESLPALKAAYDLCNV